MSSFSTDTDARLPSRIVGVIEDVMAEECRSEDGANEMKAEVVIRTGDDTVTVYLSSDGKTSEMEVQLEEPFPPDDEE